MVESRYDNHSDIQEFYQWYEGARCQSKGDYSAESGRWFVPDVQIQEYFQNLSTIRRLIRAVYHDADFLPVGPKEIRDNHSKVFFILILIGKGHLVNLFVRHDGLGDRSLPFKTPERPFPLLPTDPGFFSSFYDKQWEFCVPTFRDNMNKDFEDQTILPITQKERLAGGGSATTYKISMHPAYDKLGKEGSGNPVSQRKWYFIRSVIDLAQTSSLWHPNTYVLKTYDVDTKAAKDYHQTEVNNFRRLTFDKYDPNLIGYHGSFSQNKTYNVILEYANEGTLEDFFEKQDPPTRPEEIVRFWDSLCKILCALHLIHNVPCRNSEASYYFQG